MEDIEKLIIKCLFEDKEYARIVAPFLDAKYVRNTETKTIIKSYFNYATKYSNVPSYEEMFQLLAGDHTINEKIQENTIKYIESIKSSKFEDYDTNYLVDLTEGYFQEVVLADTILKGAEILESKDKKVEKHSLPDMFRDALKLSFKNTIGREYTDDATTTEQFDYYHHKDHKYAFPNLKTLSGLLRGGCAKKKIHVVLANTNVGKCVSFDTIIKIRNKNTGKIEQIKIGEFFERIKNK